MCEGQRLPDFKLIRNDFNDGKLLEGANLKLANSAEGTTVYSMGDCPRKKKSDLNNFKVTK